MHSLVAVLSLLSCSLAQTLDTGAVSYSVGYSSNACPQGSVSATISPDKTHITLGFDAVNVYVGPGTAPTEHTKSCIAHLDLKYPADWTFSVTGTRWHGIFTLDSGIMASLYTSYEVQSADTRTISVPIAKVNGSSDVAEQIYNVEYPVATGDRVSSSCGGSDTLLVRDRFALTAARANAYQEDGFVEEGTTLSQQIELEWTQCKV